MTLEKAYFKKFTTPSTNLKGQQQYSGQSHFKSSPNSISSCIITLAQIFNLTPKMGNAHYFHTYWVLSIFRKASWEWIYFLPTPWCGNGFAKLWTYLNTLKIFLGCSKCTGGASAMVMIIPWSNQNNNLCFKKYLTYNLKNVLLFPL